MADELQYRISIAGGIIELLFSSDIIYWRTGLQYIQGDISVCYLVHTIMPVIQSVVSKIITLLLLQVMVISTTTATAYSIGTPGQPWGKAEYKQWKDTRIKERCYHTNVVPAVQALSDKYDVIEYGQLSNDTDDKDFPLFAVRSKEWSDDKPNVFITGGVHGYETVSSICFCMLC